MSRWQSYLKSDPADWLLEDDNPSIKYFTLTNLLGKNERTADVKSAKDAIMKTGAVPKIMEKYNKGGFWEHPDDFYIRTKYKGTVWTLLLLAYMGADGKDTRIRRAADNFILRSQHRDSGGFAYEGSAKTAATVVKPFQALQVTLFLL